MVLRGWMFCLVTFDAPYLSPGLASKAPIQVVSSDIQVLLRDEDQYATGTRDRGAFQSALTGIIARANESEVTRDLSLLWMVISRRPILQLLWL